MSLRVYEHPFASFCWKALIGLHELGVEFEPVLVEDPERSELVKLWPIGKFPLLHDTATDLVVPEASTILEHLDDGRLIRDLDTRVWDRVFDSYVQLPMQKIVADALRPANGKDPIGVQEARDQLDRAYALIDARGGSWEPFTLADCAAAPALFYARIVHPWDELALPRLTEYFASLVKRPSVRRVIDDARPYRELFPLPWPASADDHQ